MVLRVWYHRERCREESSNFSGNGLKRQCRLLEKPEKPLCNQGKGDQRHRERACRQGMAKKGRGGGWGTVTWSLVSIKKRTENRVESIEKLMPLTLTSSPASHVAGDQIRWRHRSWNRGLPLLKS